MDKTITVGLSEKGIDEAIKELTAYQNELNAKNREFVKALADEAALAVETGFPGGKTTSENGIESGSNPSHSTNIESTSSRTTAASDVVVDGPDVLFIEFGSGVHYNGAVGTSPHPLGTEKGYTIGSYGKGQGAEDIWGYQGNGGEVLTHGTAASMPVYKAYLDIKDKWEQIARSIFG